ncbi:uncharacterized protein LOC135804421 isoform X1 [Sycon ciliatum]|uniref:uncharacterized protein LOC135804421 isoform X1 n=1 Tax=Sycon ciliatum TaxID=27933 RepID=UPI0031F61F21
MEGLKGHRGKGPSVSSCSPSCQRLAVHGGVSQKQTSLKDLLQKCPAQPVCSSLSQIANRPVFPGGPLISNECKSPGQFDKFACQTAVRSQEKPSPRVMITKLSHPTVGKRTDSASQRQEEGTVGEDHTILAPESSGSAEKLGNPVRKFRSRSDISLRSSGCRLLMPRERTCSQAAPTMSKPDEASTSSCTDSASDVAPPLTGITKLAAGGAGNSSGDGCNEVSSSDGETHGNSKRLCRGDKQHAAQSLNDLYAELTDLVPACRLLKRSNASTKVKQKTLSRSNILQHTCNYLNSLQQLTPPDMTLQDALEHYRGRPTDEPAASPIHQEETPINNVINNAAVPESSMAESGTNIAAPSTMLSRIGTECAKQQAGVQKAEFQASGPSSQLVVNETLVNHTAMEEELAVALSQDQAESLFNNSVAFNDSAVHMSFDEAMAVWNYSSETDNQFSQQNELGASEDNGNSTSTPHSQPTQDQQCVVSDLGDSKLLLDSSFISTELMSSGNDLQLYDFSELGQPFYTAAFDQDNSPRLQDVSGTEQTSLLAIMKSVPCPSFVVPYHGGARVTSPQDVIGSKNESSVTEEVLWDDWML